MADLQGRKVFKVFNQDFIVDERYTVTKELGQGAYGIVWYVFISSILLLRILSVSSADGCLSQRGYEYPDPGRRCDQEGHQCLQQEDPG